MKRKVTALLLAMAFVLATVAPTLAASGTGKNAEEGPATQHQVAPSGSATPGTPEEYPYIGYKDGTTGKIEKLYVEKGSNANKSTRRVVYCFNEKNARPNASDKIGELAYKKVTGDSQVFKEKVDSKSPYKDKDLIEKLKVVLLNGYPNSDAIQKSLSLTHGEMQEVTQMAVWHFTDNEYTKLSDYKTLNGRKALALAILITEAKSKTLGEEVLDSLLTDYRNDANSSYEVPKAKKMPKNATLDLYVSNGTKAEGDKEYQNLLGAQLINSEDKSVINVSKTTEPTETKNDTKITFSLQDIFGNELDGRKLQIKEKDTEKGTAKVIEEWESRKKPATYTLKEGTYEFVQKEAPKGYEKADPIKFTIDENGKVKADEAHLKTVGDHKVLIMKNDFEKAKVFYSIRDFADNELAGAKLRIVRTDGTFTQEWTSEKIPKALDLEGGYYRLELLQGPAGYEEAKAVDFTILDGSIKADKSHLDKLGKNQVLYLTAEHEESNAYFALRDILGRELAGGLLQIHNRATSELVQEWTSGSAPKGFRLDAGKYTLVQSAAPKGYTVARSVDFEITTDGKIIADMSHLKFFGDRQVLTLVNAYKSNMVEFSKVTPEGKALSGASLEVYKNTTKLDSWTSDANGYKMEFEPGTYRFHEASAPKGYKPVSDFEFDVKADGTITLGTIQHGETVALKDGRIIVTDQVDKAAPKENKKPEANKNKVQNYWVEFDVAKKDGTLLDGAIVEIYQNGKVLESWTTSASGYKTKLQPGSYRFHTKTAPKGYRLARDFNFAVNRDGSITLGKLQSGDTVTAKDRKITVYGDPVSATGARTATGTNGKKGNGKLPKTGDGVSPVIYAVGIAAVGAIVLGIGMKKRRESVDEIK